jgi:hypothetical protein
MMRCPRPRCADGIRRRPLGIRASAVGPSSGADPWQRLSYAAPMHACPSDNAIAALLSGRLTTAEAESFHRHLDQCSTCRTLVADFGRTTSAAGSHISSGDHRPRSETFPSLPHVGEAVGRYVIRRVVGVGGIGVVYEAHDPQLNRRVAVKLLRPDVIEEDDPAHRNFLLLEAQAMARLRHVNVVVIHDVGLFRGQLFVCMEYIDGATLCEWTRHQQRSWREVLDAYLSAARGLTYIHAAGLVHLDFKPDNVLVDHGDGRVVVCDFGLVQAITRGSHTQYRMVVGTPAYMAPEQKQEQQPDARSDQFSFCLALREALRACPGAGGRALLRVPSRIRRALDRGLRQAPGERFATMQALVDELSIAESHSGPRRGLAVLWATALLAVFGLLFQPVTFSAGREQKSVERGWRAPAAGAFAGVAATPQLLAFSAGSSAERVPLEPREIAADGLFGRPTRPVVARSSVTALLPDSTHLAWPPSKEIPSPPPRDNPPPLATPSCHDGSPLLCDDWIPSCPAATVAAVQRGCWTCADAESCEPLGLPLQCDDGSPLVCTLDPPNCGPRYWAAVWNGCWKCVDPFGCTDPRASPVVPGVVRDRPRCGNGICEAGEDEGSCFVDCCARGPQGNCRRCGDGVCDRGEDHQSCPQDCCATDAAGVCVPVCGNDVCEQPSESAESCPQDCCVLDDAGRCTASCGNGVCEQPSESAESCPQDCCVLDDAGRCAASCGNGVCEQPSESAESCPQDCCVLDASGRCAAG